MCNEKMNMLKKKEKQNMVSLESERPWKVISFSFFFQKKKKKNKI